MRPSPHHVAGCQYALAIRGTRRSPHEAEVAVREAGHTPRVRSQPAAPTVTKSAGDPMHVRPCGDPRAEMEALT